MSTSPSTSTTDASRETVSYRAQAERLYELLFEDPGLCPACFARKRSFYPAYDAAVAEHLSGRNRAALEACGHRIDDEGGLMVNTATSDADPNAYQEVVPERRKPRYVDGEQRIGWEIAEPPRPKTVCECGIIDYDFDNPRGTKLRFEAIENIAGHIKDREGEESFSLEAAQEVLKKAVPRDDLDGHDRTVFVGAIQLGLKRADG